MQPKVIKVLKTNIEIMSLTTNQLLKYIMLALTALHKFFYSIHLN